VGVILSGSRGAMLAAALAGVIIYAWTLRQRRPRPPQPGVLLGLLGIAYGLLLAIAKSTGEMHDAQTVHEGVLARVSSGRWPLWLDTIGGTTFLGHGIGNYYVELPLHLKAFPLAAGRPEFAENEFLHFAFELGAPGALLLLGIFMCAFIQGHGVKARCLVLALFVECCLGFPLHMPATVFLGGLLLGGGLRDAEPGGSCHGDAGAARKRVAPRWLVLCAKRLGYPDFSS
jgi:hypothetical protein